jgi:membrane protease YdiL (CAAX protease family)
MLDYVFLFYILIFMPYLAIKSAQRLAAVGAPTPDKRKAVLATTINLALMGALAIYTAYQRDQPVFVPWRPGAQEIAAGIVLLVALFGLRWLLRGWMRQTQPRNARFMAPRTWSDLPTWALLSLCAGFFEEIIYRGVLYQILLSLTGSMAASVMLAVLPFGIVHWRQGIRSVLFITVLSIALHALVNFTGTLYMAMAIHALYDFLAGVQSIAFPQPDAEAPAPAS